ADRDQGSLAPSQLFITMVEPGHGKDLIVPLVNRVEVVHNVCEVKQLTNLEHTCPLYTIRASGAHNCRKSGSLIAPRNDPRVRYRNVASIPSPFVYWLRA